MRARHHLTALVLGGILSLAAGGCSGRGPAPAGGDASAGPANVVVICVDVLRADRLGTYGYGRGTTPWLDRMARRSVVFENALSAASWTKPSVPSYFTGRYPHQHGVYEGSRKVAGGLVSDVLPPEETTLAELFRGAGFRTAAFVHNAQINAVLGFGQGFERYEDDAGDAADIRERFLGWVDGISGGPFFSYLHFLDVHWPYDPRGEWRDLFGPAPSRIDFATPAWRVLKRKIRDGHIRLSDTDRQAMMDLYDGELRHTDSEIGKLLEGLRGRGLLERTLIVFLADHGEEFLEHGKIGHGNSLYDELLRVPFILRFPGGGHAGMRISTPASLVDLLPTLADFSGLEPPGGLAGRSLLPRIEGREGDGERPLYSEGIHGSLYQQTVRLGRWKYIASVRIERKDPGADDEDALRDALAPGTRVEVEGVWMGQGEFLAEEIEIQGNQSDERDKVTGPLEEKAPDGSWIRVLGYRVGLEEGTGIESEDRTDIPLGSLHPGDMLKVYGKALSGDAFRAEKVRRRDPARRRKMKLEGVIAEPFERKGKELLFRLAGRTVRADSKADVTREETGAIPDSRKAVTDPGFADPWEAALAAGEEVRREIYDLRSDPSERRDLSATRDREMERLHGELERIRRGVPRGRKAGKLLSTAELEALRAMGYVK